MAEPIKRDFNQNLLTLQKAKLPKKLPKNYLKNATRCVLKGKITTEVFEVS